MTYDSAVAALSPAAYWKLDETSGSVVADSSGNGRDMTKGGMATLNQSPVNPSGVKSYDFGLTTSANSIASATWMNGTSYTVVAWVNGDSYSSYKCVLSRDGNTGSRGWSFYITNGKLNVFDASSDGLGSTTLSTGTAYMVAFTYTGTTLKLYVNGVIDGTLTRTLPNAANSMLMGTSRAGTGGENFPFDGRMDDVAYFPTALSAADLLGLYQTALGIGPVTVAGEVANITVAAQDGVTLVPVLLAGETAAVTVAAYDGTVDVGVQDPIVINGEVAAVVVTAYDGTLTYVVAGETANVTVAAQDGFIAGAPTIVVGETANVTVAAYAGTLQIVHSASDDDLASAGVTCITGWGTVDYDIAEPADPPNGVRSSMPRIHVS